MEKIKKTLIKLFILLILIIGSSFFCLRNINIHAASETYYFYLLNGSKVSYSLPSDDKLVFEDFTFAGWYDNVDYQGEAISTFQSKTKYYAKWLNKGTVVYLNNLDLDELSNFDNGFLKYENGHLTLDNVTLYSKEAEIVNTLNDLKITLNNTNYLYFANYNEKVYGLKSSKDIVIDGSGSLTFEGKYNYSYYLIEADNVAINDASLNVNFSFDLNGINFISSNNLNLNKANIKLECSKIKYGKILFSNENIDIVKSNIDISCTELSNISAIKGNDINIDEGSYTFYHASKMIEATNSLSIGSLDVNAVYENINEASISYGMCDFKNISYIDESLPAKISLLEEVNVDFSKALVTLENDTFSYDGNIPTLVIKSVTINGYYVDNEDYTIAKIDKVNVGNYQVKVTGLNNFKGFVYVDYNIVKAQVNIKINDVTICYGDTLPNYSYSYLEGSAIFKNDVKLTYYDTANSNYVCGVYEIRIASFKSDNYVLSVTNGTLIINEKKYDMSNVSFNDATYVYDGNYKYLTIDGSLPSGVLVSYSSNSLKDVGEIEVIASFEGDENYSSIPSLKAKLTIIKASIDTSMLSFNDATYVYDGYKKSIQVYGSLPDGSSIIYENNNQINVGCYQVKATFVVSNNYEQVDPMYATLTIKKAKINENLIIFKDETYTYDGQEKKIIASFNLPNEITVKYENNTLTNVGSIKAHVIFEVSENYESIASKEATLTITKADYDLSFLSFKDISYDYDGNEKEILAIGIPSGVKAVYENNTLTNAGSVKAKVSFIVDENHNEIDPMYATLSINKINYSLLGVNLSDAYYTYDGTLKTILIDGSLPSGVSVSYLNNAQIEAGVYKVIASFKGDANHNPISDLKATLTIKKARLNEEQIKFNDVSYIYDGLEKTITAEYFLPDEVIVSYENNTLTNAGFIVATMHFETGNNYEPIADKYATLTIKKATYYMRGVKFDDASYDYDSLEKEILISGYLPSGLSVSYENNKATNPGVYEAIAIFQGDENHNEIEPLKATLTINKLNLDISKVSINNVTCLYDGKTHNISVESEIPYKISYQGNETSGFSEPGFYEIDVCFIYDSNIYNEVDSLKGFVYIKEKTITKDDLTIINNQGFEDGNKIEINKINISDEIKELIKNHINTNFEEILSYQIENLDEGSYNYNLININIESYELIGILKNECFDVDYQIYNGILTFEEENLDYIVFIKKIKEKNETLEINLTMYIISVFLVAMFLTTIAIAIALFIKRRHKLC